MIDGQIPNYDIYLGIMWARYGTPTGKHGSGAVAKYDDAVKRKKQTGKPVVPFFFFNEEPPGSSKTEVIKQWRRRQLIAARCLSPRPLYYRGSK